MAPATASHLTTTTAASTQTSLPTSSVLYVSVNIAMTGASSAGGTNSSSGTPLPLIIVLVVGILAACGLATFVFICIRRRRSISNNSIRSRGLLWDRQARQLTTESDPKTYQINMDFAGSDFFARRGSFFTGIGTAESTTGVGSPTGNDGTNGTTRVVFPWMAKKAPMKRDLLAPPPPGRGRYVAARAGGERGKPVEMLKLHQNPLKWSVAQTASWIFWNGGEDLNTDRLVHEHGITGRMLLRLSTDALMSKLEIRDQERREKFSGAVLKLKATHMSF